MEHESVLNLRAGPDFFLKSTSIALTAMGIFFPLFGPESVLMKVPVLVICAAVGYLIHAWDNKASGVILNIFPDGRVCWELSSGERGRAVLSGGHWLSPRYVVVTATGENATHRFLVSRSLQPDRCFRALRTWIRLGLPKAVTSPVGAT